MNINEVIKFPILSEKTYAQMANNVYTFAVDPRTNRAEVKKTVEFIFEVKVAKVNIISIDKKPKKLGRSEGFTNRIKKAIVTLSEGQINIFPDEVEAPEPEKTSKEKPTKETKVAEMSEAEKKAAAKIAAKAKAKEAEKAAQTTTETTEKVTKTEEKK